MQKGFAPIIAVIIIAVLGSGAVTVQTAQKSVPGDPFYSIKEVTEDIRVVVARNKAQIYLDLAAEKNKELEILQQRDASEEKVTKLIGQIENYNKKATDLLGKAQEKGQDVTKEVEKLKTNITVQKKTLEKVIEKASDKTKEAVKQVIENTQKTVENVVQQQNNTSTNQSTASSSNNNSTPSPTKIVTATATPKPNSTTISTPTSGPTSTPTPQPTPQSIQTTVTIYPPSGSLTPQGNGSITVEITSLNSNYSPSSNLVYGKVSGSLAGLEANKSYDVWFVSASKGDLTPVGATITTDSQGLANFSNISWNATYNRSNPIAYIEIAYQFQSGVTPPSNCSQYNPCLVGNYSIP